MMLHKPPTPKPLRKGPESALSSLLGLPSLLPKQLSGQLRPEPVSGERDRKKRHLCHKAWIPCGKSTQREREESRLDDPQ